MKKIMKKITAIMLSLVMVFGCIPTFTNVVRAEQGVYIVGLNNFSDSNQVDQINFQTFKVMGSDLAFYSLNDPTNCKIEVFCDGVELDSTDTLSKSNDYTVNIIANNPADFKNDRFSLEAFHNYPNPYAVSVSGITDWQNNGTTFSIDAGGVLTITMQLKAKAVSNTVSSITIEESGELYVNPTIDTITFNVCDTDKNKYEITDVSPDWCNSSDCGIPEIIAADTDLYKKIQVETKDGYVFDDPVTTSYDDDNNVTFTRVDDTHAYFVVKRNATNFDGIYVNYEEPKNLDEFYALNESDVTVQGATNDFHIAKESLYITSNNPNHIGYDLFVVYAEFENSDAASQINKKFYLRNENISNKYYPSLASLIGDADLLDYAVTLSGQGKNYMFVEKFDFRKTANFNVSLNTGMKVLDVLNSVTYNVEHGGDEPVKMAICDSTGEVELPLDYILEAGKTYYLGIVIPDVKYYYDYNSVNLNGTKINFVKTPTPDTRTYYSFITAKKALCLVYEFSTNSSSGGSKKYKAEDNNTAMDVSGSGKKGAKRIITPIEGRKVKEVLVKDKKDNLVEVTMNEDGTYEFIQPASDVNIEIIYADREMKLELGTINVTLDGEAVSTDASLIVNSNNEKLVPIRVVAENLGGSVEWSEKAPNSIGLVKGEKTVDITLGNRTVKVNGEEVELSLAPIALNNRTYLPVDFYEEVLGLYVDTYNDQMREYLRLIEQ